MQSKTLNKIPKKELDKLVETYEVRTFMDNDPSRFLRKFSSKKDAEIAGFISAVFAFGKRDAFIEKLDYIFNKMSPSPYDFLLNFNGKGFNGFKYRFIKEEDLCNLLFCLKKLYSSGETLETLFAHGYKQSKSLKGMLKSVSNYFYSTSKNPDTTGFKHLLPDPDKGSAMKRMCLFLRWMVREGEVDLGLWNFIPKSELIIPLDTHVIQQAKKMGLIENPKADFKTAILLTNVLKEFDPKDPVKYDFALFGYGVEND